MAGASFPVRQAPHSVEVATLFLSRAFNRYQAEAQGKQLVTFAWSDAGGAASLTLGGADGTWSTPVTGAFGGLAAEGRVPAEAVHALAAQVTSWAAHAADVETVRIRLPPGCFGDPLQPVLQNALFREGWALEQLDLNQHLPVTSAQGFAKALGETRRKELRRLDRAGAEFATFGPDEAQAVYDAIAENRAARGYPMTMSWPQVAALRDAFPDRVQFHGVVRDGQLMAGAVRLIVSPAYQYVFYWGERPAFRRESPIGVLARGLIAVCHEAGAEVLDLGVSTDASVLNPGLLAFKESLGAVTTARPTFVLRR